MSTPRADTLRRLEISEQPLFTGYFSASSGVLDDHLESWFLSYAEPPTHVPEGMESVVGLGMGETWLPPPGSAEAAQDQTVSSPTHVDAET